MHKAAAPNILLLVTLLGASPAAARSAPRPAADRPAPRSSDKDVEMGEALERALERRWGKKRAVEVVQARRYPKAGGFELELFAGTLPSDPFLFYLAGGLRMAYHFDERFALEVHGAYTYGLDTGLREQLQEDDALVKARIRDRVLTRFGLSVLWSPFYGKFAFYNRKLGHFDVFFVADASGVYLQGEPTLGLSDGVWPEVGLGVGLRLFLTKLLSLRFECRQRLAFREGVGDAAIRLTWPTELNLGLSFLFGGGSRSKQ